MLKIGPRIQNINKDINRYLWKNTANARYIKNKDLTMISGIATGVQILRLPSWDIPDIGIAAGLATITYGALRNTLKNLISLLPVRKRAIMIKKAAKHNSKI